SFFSRKRHHQRRCVCRSTLLFPIRALQQKIKELVMESPAHNFGGVCYKVLYYGAENLRTIQQVLEITMIEQLGRAIDLKEMDCVRIHRPGISREVLFRTEKLTIKLLSGSSTGKKHEATRLPLPKPRNVQPPLTAISELEMLVFLPPIDDLHLIYSMIRVHLL
ncbi:unnamed protein product, partial [Linum tenue]